MQVPVLIGASLLFFVLEMDGRLLRIEGILLFCLALGYLGFTVHHGRAEVHDGHFAEQLELDTHRTSNSLANRPRDRPARGDDCRRSLHAGLWIGAEALSFDIPVMLACAFLLSPVVFTERRISRLEGGILLVAYLSYGTRSSQTKHLNIHRRIASYDTEVVKPATFGRMTMINRFGIRVLASFIFLAAVSFPCIAAAGSVWDADVPDYYDDDETRVNVIVRAGVGSLFGPGFKTGQPSYAKEPFFSMDPSNGKRFLPLRQALSTAGAAVTAELSTEGPWAFGLTGLAGFNAAAANNTGHMRPAFVAKEKLQGPTAGAGARVRYGDNEDGFTLDLTYSHTNLIGSVEWGSRRTDTTARYSYDVHKYNLLLGYELSLNGPFFGYAQAGAQYLPEQTSEIKQSGIVPKSTGTDDHYFAEELPEIDREVTFHPELQYALGVGLGVRF